MIPLLGAQLPEHKKVKIALTKFQGIGIPTAERICARLTIHETCKMEELNENQMNQLAAILSDMKLGADLEREVKNNIMHLRAIGTTKGKRHAMGYPVRGQRTQTNAKTARKLNPRRIREFSSLARCSIRSSESSSLNYSISPTNLGKIYTWSCSPMRAECEMRGLIMDVRGLTMLSSREFIRRGGFAWGRTRTLFDSFLLAAMSLLLKLKIQGIRSFDPDTPAQIEFQTPLTILVGHNGAGKTSIIEALKYATTGELPPNAKVGGAFVYDPKIKGEPNVKAQVQLLFRGVDGNEFICSRSLQVKQTAGKLSLSTIETLLQSTNRQTGEKSSITGRCAAIDAEVPIQLGVSTAIIDNVIFCHQEDSFWPLSDATTLKKKFDEIFAATRYTKALEAIKILKKQKTIELKEEEMKLAHLSQNKEKADKLSIRQEALLRNAGEYKKKVEVLETTVEETSKLIEGLLEAIHKLNMLKAQLKEKKNEQSFLESRIKIVSETLKELHESDEELKRLYEEYSTKVNTNDETKQDLQKKKDQISSEISHLRSDLNTLHLKLGKFQAQYEVNQQRIIEREKLIQNISNVRNIPGYENVPFSNEKINSFAEILNTQIFNQERMISEIRGETRHFQQELNNQLAAFNSELKRHQQTKELAQNQIILCRSKLDQNNLEIDSVKVSQAEIKSIEAQYNEELESLENVKRTLMNDNSQSKLTQLNADLRESTNKLTEIDQEITALNFEVTTRSKLDIQRKEKRKKETNFQNLLETHQGQLRIFLNREVQIETVAGDMEEALRKKQHQTKYIAEQLQKEKLGISAIEAKLTKSHGEVQRKRGQCQDHERGLNKLCKGAQLPELLQDTEAAVLGLRDELSSTTSASSLYTRFIDQSKTTHACPLCNRGFSTTKDHEEMLRRLEKLTGDRVPERIATIKRDVAQEEKRLAELRGLKSLWDDVIRLKNIEIPDIQKEIGDLEGEKSKKLSSIGDISDELLALESEVQHIEDLCKIAGEISRLSNELGGLNKEIEYLQQELSYSGSTKTIDEATEEREAVQQKLLKLNREINQLNSRIQARQREIQGRQEQLHQTHQQLMEKQHQILMKEQAEKKKQELMAEIKQQELLIIEADAQIQFINPQITVATKSLKEKSELALEQENSAISELQRLQNALNKINTATREIESFTQEANPEILNRSGEEAKRLEDEITKKTRDIEAIDAQTHNIDRLASQVENTRRIIKDNVDYRKLQSDIETCVAEIQHLDGEIGKQDDTGYSNQLKVLRNKQEEASSKKSMLSGELLQMEQQINFIEKEFETDYKDVKENCRRQLIIFKTLEMAVDDLVTYAKTLDSAIMKYHSMKMVEINKFIQDLWANIYQGNDIDRIEIRSEQETVRANRTYNYRVVMVKGNIELDLRGRCSAGQKVLASIIIRMALAETFCVNCGVLALDEPTTNLDHDNMLSLARSLSDVIRKRQAQKNFQLILISHDEEFVREIARSELTDYCYKVKKNSHIIEQIPIDQL
ncbi:hypothetical protein G9A89_011870 [Geosiphon pyriformis]|nr:hypothetical protein G9A89_011870 [Geosiphon pyriformis]